MMDLHVESAEWMVSALCAQVDPEIFFPERGQSTREARIICRRCPVAAECKDYAETLHPAYGIWSGLTENERRRIPRQRATEEAAA